MGIEVLRRDCEVDLNKPPTPGRRGLVMSLGGVCDKKSAFLGYFGYS